MKYSGLKEKVVQLVARARKPVYTPAEAYQTMNKIFQPVRKTAETLKEREITQLPKTSMWRYFPGMLAGNLTETIVPQSPMEAALYALPVGKLGGMATKVAGKTALGKAALKVGGKVFKKIEPEISKGAVDLGVEFFNKNKKVLIKEYIKKFGNVINPDDAKKLFVPVGYNGANAKQFHEASSLLSKAVYDYLLPIGKKIGDGTIVFTAGGSGVGKTTAINETKRLISQGIRNNPSITYDANFANTIEAFKKIDKALTNGYQPVVQYVYRNPISAWKDGVLKRIEGGQGRYVPMDTHLKLHSGSKDTVQAVLEKYGDKVKKILIENEGGAKDIKEVGVDYLYKIKYNKPKILQKLYEDTIKELKSGRIKAEQLGERFSESELGRGIKDWLAKGGEIKPIKKASQEAITSFGKISGITKYEKTLEAMVRRLQMLKAIK